MRITQVEYKRLHSFGNFENETIGAVAEVPEGEDAADVLIHLQEWVKAELSVREQTGDLRTDIHVLQQRKGDLEGQIRALEAQYDRIVGFLQRLNIPLPVGWNSDDLPF